MICDMITGMEECPSGDSLPKDPPIQQLPSMYWKCMLPVVSALLNFHTIEAQETVSAAVMSELD